MSKIRLVAVFLVTLAVINWPVNLIAAPKQVVRQPAKKFAIQTGQSASSSKFDDVEYFYQAANEKKTKPVKGDLVLDSGSNAIRFVGEGGAQLDIPYNTITKIIYERTAKPRYTAAVLVSPLFLFSKSKKHFLTIQYKRADGQGQFALLRLSKNNYQSVLAATEAQTGAKVERTEEK